VGLPFAELAAGDATIVVVEPVQLEGLSVRGFILCEKAIPERSLAAARDAIGEGTAGRAGDRAALKHDAIRALVRSSEFRALVEPVLGDRCFAVRALWFDKSARSNWSVPPHQDLSVTVRERLDVPGFGPWSRKAGIVHALAPSSVLEQMLAVRIHIDRAGPAEGALRLIPATHARRLTPLEIERASAGDEVTCSAEPGDVLVMRPLVVHSSSKMRERGRRRVLHVELAARDLPGGLEWHDRA
jgi:hypothetical protein